MGHRTHQFINLLEETALLKKAPLGIDGSSQKTNNTWKKTTREMKCRNKDIHQHTPFSFVAKYKACNPIRNYKLKLFLKSDIFQMFKTAQNQHKLRILSAKIEIILLHSYTKTIYLQCYAITLFTFYLH